MLEQRQLRILSLVYIPNECKRLLDVANPDRVGYSIEDSCSILFHTKLLIALRQLLSGLHSEYGHVTAQKQQRRAPRHRGSYPQPAKLGDRVTEVCIRPSRNTQEGESGMANPNDPISYDHFETFRGIKIKVPAGVNPTAIKRLPKILDEMLLRCQDTLLARMIERNAAVAIIPKDRYITALPEFASLPEKDENGDDNRSFAVRGKGAVRRQPVTAVAEDDLLQLSLHRPYTESLSHHEIAHAIMNLGFCEAELQEWRGIFEAAKASNRFPGTWMMSKTSDEFWAKLSQTHFGVNDDNSFNSPASIQREDPVAGAFLQRIYGPRQEGH